MEEFFGVPGTRYAIPKYQRGYAWTDTQVDEFWEDLTAIESEHQHFLGPVALHNPNKGEALVDFGERRRGICGLVHVEAPSASADLSGSSVAVG